MIVAYLHPGEMGASLAAAAAARRTGLWLGQGRSPATRKRALAAGLDDAGTLTALLESADLVVSVCPPDTAVDVARQVADAGFDGLYADLNAIAPDTARTISAQFTHFVDGGIVGPPVRSSGTTRLYLSGERADEVADVWTGSLLDVRVLGVDIGAASALKACYASWTKISGALLLAVRAAAEAEGVSHDLLDEWSISQPDLRARSERNASSSGPKAWRFVGEMNELGGWFASHGLPDGFASAAADVYDRMAPLKDQSSPARSDVITALRARGHRLG